MRWLSHRVLTALGWRFVGELPDRPKMVIVGAPHTSNWDFILFLAALHHWKMTVRYLAKRTLFRWPIGYLFGALGGIPVDRRQAGGVVGQVNQVFGGEERMILVVAPEGTRKPAPMWKSGFIEIAEQSGVPVVPARVSAIDKTLTLGPAMEVGPDRKAFMDRLRDFYGDAEGIRRRQRGPVRIARES